MGSKSLCLVCFISIALHFSSVFVSASEGPTPTFFSTTLINLPTTRCIGKGEMLFRVSHHFYLPSNSGYHSFYGLDGPSYIMMSLGYGLRDDWSFTLGRTNLRDEVELSSAFSLFQQGETRAIPFSAVITGTVSLTTETPEGTRVFDRDNVRLSIQTSLSRQFTDGVSFLVAPSFSSNTDYSKPRDKNTFSLGIGGRVMVLENISLVGEMVPVLSGYETGVDTWGFGVEVKKGGHVFHLFANNAYGLTPNQYLPGGDLKLADGDIRYGFNIYRSF